jgi:hypothetical protein
MPKGFFTQGVAVLLRSPVDLDEVAKCLSAWEIVKRVEASESPEMSGASLLVSYRPEVNGYITVDLHPAKWPDHMGDPKDEPMLFGAWSMGHFGPLAYPHGLQRATGQSWRWEGAAEAVAQHTAVLRLRASYVYGAGGDAPVMPADCDAQDELMFLMRMVVALGALKEAICYFNPNGEVVLSFPELAESLDYHAKHDLPPLDIWANVRLFNLSESWALMDCVGSGQLDQCDHEVAFPRSLTNPGAVDPFIRNISLYLLQKGDVIKDGDTIDGPGAIKWQAKRFKSGLNDPPREVMRWLPCGVKGVPAPLFGPDAAAAPPEKKPKWKFW